MTKPRKEDSELLKAIINKVWTIDRIKRSAAFELEDQFNFLGELEDLDNANQRCELKSCGHKKGSKGRFPRRKMCVINGRTTLKVKKNKIVAYLMFTDDHPHITRFVFNGNEKKGYRFTFTVIGVPHSGGEGHDHDHAVNITHNDSGGGTAN